MSPVGAFSFFHLLVLMGLMSPVGVPPLPETPAISNVAPESCLFYMSSAGRAEPQASSANQTEQLLAEPEVKKFAAQVETIVKGLLDKSLKEPGAPPMSSEEITSLVKTLLTRPMAIYVGSVKVQPDGPDVRGGLIMHLGDSTPQIKQELDKLTQLLPPGKVVPVKDGNDTWQSFKPEPKVTFYWGIKDNCFMAAIGEGEIQALAKRASGKTPAWLAEIKKNAGIERISNVMYVNVKTIVEIATPHGPPDAPQVFDALGIGNLKHVSVVGGLDKVGFVTKTNLTFDGPTKGIFAFSDAKPLAAADFANVPADAVMAVALRLDAAAVYDAYFKMVEQIKPEAKADMLGVLEEVEEAYGLNLREDILAPLGDKICFFNSTKEGGPLGGTVVVSLKDAKKAKASNDKLCDLLKKLGQNNPNTPKIKKSELDGKTLFSLQIPGAPFMPTWCLTDKELIVGMMPEKTKAYLARKPDFKSLATSPDVLKNLQGGAGPLALVYADTKQIFDQIYPTLPMLVAMAAPAIQQQVVDLMPMMPSAGAISNHLLPLVGTVRKTATGIEITERSSLPMSVAMSPANPVTVALLLPAVQAARAAARRANSINNLKQIELGILSYESQKGHFPLAVQADKNGKPLLSWRVAILPYLDRNDLYQQFHLDEPWDSENNKKLIEKMPDIYRSPNSNADPGKTNYLTIRGEKTIFNSKGKRLGMSNIVDNTSNTIMIVEANDDKAVTWTKPDDFEYDENNPVKGLDGMHPGIFLAGFADGHVSAISLSIDPATLKKLFNCEDKKTIDESEIP